MASLNNELIFDILSRLPVKDLVRFKCVCKSWHALVADPRFIKAQFDRSIEGDKLSFIFTHNHQMFHLNGFRNDPTKLDLSFKSLPIMVEQILGSYNGMVCFNLYSYGVFVLNPSTRELKNLPELPGYWRYIYSLVWGFGFCSNTQRFKVVRIAYFKSGYGSNSEKSHVIVHTVGSNTSSGWRTINQVPADIYIGTQTIVNGVPHWKGSRGKGSDFSLKIVCFDVEREVFDEIPYPDNEVGNMNLDFLAELRGCLCVFRVFTLIASGHIEIWVMDEYGIKESWNRKFTISHSIVVDNSLLSCQPLWFLHSGEILIKYGDRVVLYNPSNESVRDLKIPGFKLVHVESLRLIGG